MDFTEENLRTIFYKKGSTRKLVMDIGYMDFDFKSISEKIDNKQIFESAEFENYLLAYYLSARVTNGPKLFGRVKIEIETIVKEIDQELEE